MYADGKRTRTTAATSNVTITDVDIAATSNVTMTDTDNDNDEADDRRQRRRLLTNASALSAGVASSTRGSSSRATATSNNDMLTDDDAHTSNTIEQNVSSIDHLIDRTMQRKPGVTLRAGQREAIRAIVQPDVLNVMLKMPTGAGKTMCVEVAAEIASDKQQVLVLVVPLVSLAGDMERRFGRSAFLGDNVDWSRDLIHGLYVVRPETFVSAVVVGALCRAHSANRLAAIVFDESTSLLASFYRPAIWALRYALAALRRVQPVKLVGMSGTATSRQQQTFLAFAGVNGAVRVVSVRMLEFKVEIDRRVHAQRRGVVDKQTGFQLVCDIVANAQINGRGGVCIVITRLVADVYTLRDRVAATVFNNDMNRIAVVIGASNNDSSSTDVGLLSASQ